jgi:hypothetical protein
MDCKITIYFIHACTQETKKYASLRYGWSGKLTLWSSARGRWLRRSISSVRCMLWRQKYHHSIQWNNISKFLTIVLVNVNIKHLRWLDIVITKTLLKNHKQNRVIIFTRRLRKLINEMKDLPKQWTLIRLLLEFLLEFTVPKWLDVSSCSRHLTSLRVFYSVLCQLLTSLEFPILEKQCAISLYFVWWPIFKFCMLYCTAKNFHYTKNKKIL